MKKILTVLIALAILVSLGACTKKEEDVEPQTDIISENAGGSENSEETKEDNTGGEELLGGWKIFEEAFAKNLDEEDTARFEIAMKDLTGAGYEPVAVLARNIDIGVETIYLCLGNTVATGSKSWYILDIYSDQEGFSKVQSIKKLDILDIHTAEDDYPSTLPEDWQIASSARPGSLTEESEKAFTDAIDSLTGSNFIPATLLASQLVSGMNYRYIVYGDLLTEYPAPQNIFVAEVYQPLNDKASLTYMEPLDLLYYITPE
ncbi:MAG: hypothetical protein IIZ47_07100 [Erysipelotrichaceae bacterium]|nr:hypothetical protein [Erysipelotrichaceae bacterium]